MGCSSPFPLFVILNLFQDPFLHPHGAIGFGSHRAGRWRGSACSVEAEWVLKQVQDDEEGSGVAYSMPFHSGEAY
jgi:hypothetical protein